LVGGAAAADHPGGLRGVVGGGVRGVVGHAPGEDLQKQHDDAQQDWRAEGEFYGDGTAVIVQHTTPAASLGTGRIHYWNTQLSMISSTPV
jgi:hypothetical protein